jgi:hypothetical protein
MLKIYVLLITLILLGDLMSYLRISHSQEIAMVQLKERLHLISEQLSVSPYLVSNDSQSTGNDAIDSVNGERLRGELAPVIRDVISDILAQELADELAYLLSSLSPDQVTIQTQGLTSYKDKEATNAAVEEVNAILAAAIDQGVWDLYSARAFTIAIDRLADEEQIEAYNRQAVAFNTGKLQLDSETDPMLLLMGTGAKQ